MSKDDNCRGPWGWSRRERERGGSSWFRGPSFAPWNWDGQRPGRMFAQGDLRLLLLALIADKPSHGYDLIRTIEARFSGAYAPSPGVVYPTLTLLEEQDLIRAENASGAKKSYAATDAGLNYLADHADEVRALMERIGVMADNTSGPSFPGGLMPAIMALGQAIMARSRLRSPAEDARVRAILEKAARDVLSGKDTS